MKQIKNKIIATTILSSTILPSYHFIANADEKNNLIMVDSIESNITNTNLNQFKETSKELSKEVINEKSKNTSENSYKLNSREQSKIKLKQTPNVIESTIKLTDLKNDIDDLKKSAISKSTLNKSKSELKTKIKEINTLKKEINLNKKDLNEKIKTDTKLTKETEKKLDKVIDQLNNTEQNIPVAEINLLKDIKNNYLAIVDQSEKDLQVAKITLNESNAKIKELEEVAKIYNKTLISKEKKINKEEKEKAKIEAERKQKELIAEKNKQQELENKALEQQQLLNNDNISSDNTLIENNSNNIENQANITTNIEHNNEINNNKLNYQSTNSNNKNITASNSNVVNIAMKYLGTPYVWGGRQPGGFDCSGFMQYIFREAYGKEIGPTTVPQESSGTTLSVNQAQPGDLLFYGAHGATYHVGLYIGNGQMIHAPKPGDSVKIENIKYFTPNFAVHVN